MLCFLLMGCFGLSGNYLFLLLILCVMPGSLGIIWFVLWMTLVSSSPDRSHRITEAERLFISKCLDSADTQVIVLRLLAMSQLYHCIVAVVQC